MSEARLLPVGRGPGNSGKFSGPNISLTVQCKRNPAPVPLEHLVCLLQSTAGAIGEGFT
jgi:hypothetical protein